MRKTKGQALIEGLMALGFFSVLVPTVGLAFLLITTKVWSHHWLYQSLLCQAQGRAHWECRRVFLNKTTKLLPFIKETHLQLQSTATGYFGLYRTSVGDIQLKGHRRLER